MPELILETTSTAQWHRLVQDAEARSRTRLDEDAQSYLVFLLMRYLRRADLLRRLLAVGYLRAMQARGQLRDERLRDVGDECLIVAGLFPGQARRRRVTLSYVVALGRGAYGELGTRSDSSLASLYERLAETFPELLDVLHAVRDDPEMPSADRLWTAADRYWETGSPAARRELEDAGCLVPPRQLTRRH